MFGDPVENLYGWPTKGFMELGSCKNGMNFGARDQGTTIQSVGVGDIKDYDYIEDVDALTTLSLNEMPTEEYLLRDGDLVFVRSNGNKNLVGRCIAIYPHGIPVTFSGFCIRFRKESDAVLLDYLLRYLKMPEVRLKMTGRGANIQNLNQKILAALQVPVPPLDKQSEYVALVKQSDKSKFTGFKSQFIEMFGDPTANPKGWTKLTVRDAVKEGYIARPLDGNHGAKHPKGDDYVPEGIPFIMAQDLKDKQVDFDNCHFITEKQASTLKKGWAKTGDVLLTNKGTIGRVAIVQESKYEDMLLTPQITYYRCLKGIDNEYLAGYFITDFFVNQLERLTTGTTRASVTITQQENLELIIPPVDMQREFVTFVKQSDKSK